MNSEPGQRKGGSQVGLKPETIDILRLYDKWIVAAVRCNRVRFELQGTRSERVFIETTILASGEGSADGQLTLTRFTQGDSLLQPGKTYLIGAYDDQGLSPAYTLVEWKAISPEDALQEATKAHQAVINAVGSK